MSRPWKIGLSLVGAALIVFVAASAFAAWEISRHARKWGTERLGQRYNSGA